MDVSLFLMFILSTTAVVCDGKLCNSTFTNEISIAKPGGKDKEQCLRGNSSVSCETLDFVLGKIINNSYIYLRNSTKLNIKSDQSLNENYNLANLNEFAFCGQQQEVYNIDCEHGRGLVMASSNYITIEHLRFRNCGSLQASQDEDILQFYTGIHIRNTVDVVVNDCVIENSIGKGMTLFDVGGHVIFSWTTFLENQGILSEIDGAASEIVHSGGGLFIEFTYGGGSYPFKSNKNSYYFQHCSFINNNATWKDSNKTNLDPSTMTRNNSVIFGCGGGFGMMFKKNARDNVVLIENSVFKNNRADWGGGYMFVFQDKSENNSVHLKNVTVEYNHANFAGGGGKFELYPQFLLEDMLKTPGNYFRHENCTFRANKACWGGGIGVFGTTMLLVLNGTNHNTLILANCWWINNEAIVGSAIGLISDWLDSKIPKQEGKGVPYTVHFVNCRFNHNIITNKMMNIGNNVIGTGALYTDIAPMVMQNVSLLSNNGTALVIDWSVVKILGNVTFYGNIGSRGGAIALYGRSKLVLAEGSFLVFDSNRAFLQGGAIYARSQGPNLKAFRIRLLDRSKCFFSYEYDKPPHLWNASVSFYNNTAPSRMGDSIYADTLQFCRKYGNFSDIFEWRTFHYQHDDANDSRLEIVTDPATIATKKSSWRAYPGQRIYPQIELYDEKNQSANGLLKLSIIPEKNGTLHLGKESSHYVYVSAGQTMSPITLESPKVFDQFDIILSSVYTQIISTTVGNMSTLGFCYAGYTFDKTRQECVCLKKEEWPLGYSHCVNDGETIFMKPGFWAYVDSKGKFSTLKCPSGYCDCKNKSDAGECIFKKFHQPAADIQCHGHRTGKLCGSCINNYSVVAGSQKCEQCTNTGILWLFLMAAGLTVVVLGIIYFKLDFFSGPLNSWLYSYHIIALLTQDSDVNLDPFITFIIGLTQGVFDIGKDTCFWNGMDELQKNTLRNFMPVYCLLLIYIINKLLHCFTNIWLTNNHSIHHALVTIVIMSYASLLQNTATILQPITINGTWYVYIQASKPYFGCYHLRFAIPALIVLIFLVLPFPFIIVFNSFFTQHFRRLRSFIPLFQVLQSPYLPGRTWFASYYIFCRIIFILLSMGRQVYPHTEVAIWEFASVLVLMIFVLLRPYNDDNECFFKVDTIFLSLLCLFNCLRMAAQLNVKNVNFYNCLIHILTYVPFLYSVALLVLYIRNKYRERRYEELNN